MEVDTFQDEFELCRAQTTTTPGVDALRECCLDVVDHCDTKLDAVVEVASMSEVRTLGLDTSVQFLDNDLVVVGDGDLDLIVVAGNDAVLDAQATEVSAATFTNLLQPLESCLTQGMVPSGIEHEEARVEVEWHEFWSD